MSPIVIDYHSWSPIVIDYHSCYAYLFYDFERNRKRLTQNELALIDAIARKYVKMSYGADEQSHHIQSCKFGYIVVHRAYLPALLDELAPILEKITSAKT